MSVISVRESLDSPTGEWDNEGGRRYVRKFIVKTNSDGDGPVTILGDPLVPQLFDQFASGNDWDLGAYAERPRCQRWKDSKRTWLVECAYSTRDKEECKDVENDDPLLEPAIISGGATLFQKSIEKDDAGSLMENSAGDVFEDLKKDDSRPTIRIQKNFASINLQTYADYTNALNSDAFFGLGAGKWKAKAPQWTQQYRGACNAYYTVTFEFEASFDGWDLEPLDRGAFYLDADDNRVLYDDKHGKPLNKPGLLNGSGSKLGVSDPPVYQGPFTIYKSKAYASLGIPTSF